MALKGVKSFVSSITAVSKLQTNPGIQIRILKINNVYVAIIDKTVFQDKTCALLNDTKSQSRKSIKTN